MNSKHVVSPALFGQVIRYVGDGRPDVESIDSDNMLVGFAQNFLEQFSRNYLGKEIVGFTNRSAEQLRSVRRSLAARENTEPAQLVIYSLEPLCTRIPEIEYSDSRSDVDDFHEWLIPELLAKIESWARLSLGDPLVHAAADEAVVAYRLAFGVPAP